MRTVALVPMGAHSERIPGKNRRDLGGQPLYTWILGWLRGVPAIDEIVVDTDDPEISAALRDSDVRVIDRPERLRGGRVSMNMVLAHDVEQVPADIYIQTHATNPFLTIHTIIQALACYRGRMPDRDSLLGVTRVHKRFWNPETGGPVNHDPRRLLRTQDLPGLWEENSCLYIFSPESFWGAGGNRIGRRPCFFEVPAAEAVDIDTMEDLRAARTRMEARTA
jgi:CMP-N-acetylneuraminic acid synthetase